MHRGRSSLAAAGELRPICIFPRGSIVRGAHGPVTLGQIRDWVAGHAISTSRPVTLGLVLRLGRSVQRDSARFAWWANPTHRRSYRHLAEQPSDALAFPPQRGLRRPALAQHFGRHGQKPLTARQLALSGASSRASRGQLALPAKHGQNFGSNSPPGLASPPFFRRV